MNKKIQNNEKFYRKCFYIKIRDLNANNKYSSVIKEATKYLEMYPDDINIRFMRAFAYKKLKMFEESISDLKYNLNKQIDEYSLTSLYFIYYHLNKYEEAIQLLPIIYKTECIRPVSAYITEIVMKKKLGINVEKKEGVKCDYVEKQIFNYNRRLALEHIKKHLSNNNDENSKYDENIDLMYLFEFITNNIDNTKKDIVEEVLETHYFLIANLGYSNDSVCNFLKVVVIPNTNNIITMYPVDSVECKYIDNIEIDYKKLFKMENKIKTKSRIDRFNEKYKRI